MKILIYTHPDKRNSSSYLKTIPEKVPATTVAVFDFKGFFDMLRSERIGQVIAVLMISSDQELEDFIAIKGLLYDGPVVIILLDYEDSMISRALSLKPKFLAFRRNDIDAVCEVIKKLI